MNHWYVLRSKSRQELRATEHLERQGFFVYCPMLEKKGMKCVPLFPSYLFLQYNDLQESFEFDRVRSTRGVLTFVRCGHEFARLSDELVSDIKCQEEWQSSLPCFEIGQRVEFIEGPFKGIQAVFQCERGRDRCDVLIGLINSNVNMGLLSKV
ncbi:MAG: hypothetical protein KAG53_04090 [Endozoicomonadaceae bacterium]|nr:hypothetical protein [Endozoicomonadaceae bacterium]